MAGRVHIGIVLALAGCLSTPALLSAQSFSEDGRISGGANALYWTRSGPQDGTVLTDGTRSLSPSDLHLNWEPGVEGWITFQSADSPLGLDVRYMWVDDFHDRLDAVLIDPFLGSANTALEFHSSLQGAEISGTWQANEWLSILAGFRWVQLKETFAMGVDATNFPFTAQINHSTVNDLYGGQIGANLALIDRDFLRINWLTKLGMYSNVNSYNLDSSFAGLGAISLNFPGSDVAFTTESRLGGTWWLTSNIAFDAGYEVLLIDGVFRGDTVAVGGAAFDALRANDTVLYHGAYFGLTFLFP